MKKHFSLYPFIIAVCLLPFIAFSQSLQTLPIDTNWNQLPGVLNRINVPVFPNRDYNIVSFGAPTNGTTIATTFIQKAIDSCSNAGGGRVIVPPGTFLTGALTLKSNVNLHISSGATLKFSTSTSNYLPVVLTRFEGIECYNYSPFIYSYNAQNIALTGSGTLNGQASNSNWWAWKTSAQATLDDTLLNQEGQAGTPVNQRVFGAGHQLRPVFVQFYASRNILIDSVTIINSPMHELNPVLCQNLTIQNVTINSLGPNNDGCDPECCSDVLINNCTFSTGDDCIAVKSGRNNDGRRVNTPSQYIVIENCNMGNGHGGVTLGSECSGGIHNVYVQNCSLKGTSLSSVLRFKTNSLRGGIIENIFMRNCSIGKVAGDLLDVDMYYQEGDVGSFTPIIRNIEIDSCNSTGSQEAFTVNAYQRSPLTDIKIVGCNFASAGPVGTHTNITRMQVYNTLINNAVPLIPAPPAGYTEAEAYSDKLSWGWSNVLQGYNGNGYMEFADSANSIEWQVSKSNNETDTINFTYANTDSVNKPCSLLINGANAGQITFPPTKSGWATIKKTAPFYTGTNTVRLISLSSKPGAYLDRFKLIQGNLLNAVSDTFNLCSGDTIFFSSGYHGNTLWQWQVNNGNGYSNITNNTIYSGTTKDTLHFTNPPTSIYGYKYRCRILNNTDTLYSPEYTIHFASTWTGALDNTWENPANWSCGELPDSNTDVIINTGVPFYPTVNYNTAYRSIKATPQASINIKAGVLFLLTGKTD